MIFLSDILSCLKRHRCSSDPCSASHRALIDKAIFQMNELHQKVRLNDQILVVNENFSPYGLTMGADEKRVLTLLKDQNITAKYNLSKEMNCLYKVYFVDVLLDGCCMVAQFHVKNDRLSLVFTSFSTRLCISQFEKIVMGLIDYIPGDSRCFGVIPFYVKDKQDIILQIHNPMGYPSLLYYSSESALN